MVQAPTFSVVIPLYNKERSISRALQSVFAQERSADFIVVVDDGSTDSSAARCEEALAQLKVGQPQSRLLRQSNLGVSVARNVGAEEFASDYIAFLDADDEWLPIHLSELERLARACPDAGMLSTRYARLDENGQPAVEPSALPPQHFGEVANGLDAYRRGYGILHTSTIAVRREAWTRSGGFPPGERKSQDIHLWLRLLLNERFAHSDCCTGIWHEEETGVARRSGAVPSHFSYFLGTAEGRAYLSNPDLVAFLSANMKSHVGGHRMRRDSKVLTELLRLSAALPLSVQVEARILALLPARALGGIARVRQRLRQRRSRSS